MTEALQIDNQGRKDDSEKVRYDLIPWQAIEAIARVLTKGAKKYEPYNWSRGIVYSRLVRAGIGHILSFFRGEDFDPETNEHHLAHAACCVLFLLHYELNKRKYTQQDDRKLIDLGEPS